MEHVIIALYFTGLFIAANAFIAAVVIALIFALIIMVKGETWFDAVAEKHPEWLEDSDETLITIIRKRNI